jgi:hypothetical protein
MQLDHPDVVCDFKIMWCSFPASMVTSCQHRHNSSTTVGKWSSGDVGPWLFWHMAHCLMRGIGPLPRVWLVNNWKTTWFRRWAKATDACSTVVHIQACIIATEQHTYTHACMRHIIHACIHHCSYLQVVKHVENATKCRWKTIHAYRNNTTRTVL